MARCVLVTASTSDVFFGGAGEGGAAGVTVASPAATVGGLGGAGGTGAASGAGGEGGAPSCHVAWEPPAPVVPPLDIILVVDNSGSMHEEIAAIEQNINVNFAQLLLGSGIDFQLVVVSNHGSGGTELCIGPPLSNATTCQGAPGETESLFHHYDVDIQSFDALCRLIETYDGTAPDQWGLHPQGWRKWLRAEARKAFLLFTDDRVNCTLGGVSWNDFDDPHPTASLSAAAALATAFDHRLLGLDSEQFGNLADRRYRFYSVLGLKEKPPPDQGGAYAPWETIVSSKCSGGMSIGAGYQWLSKGTDAGRYALCAPQSYDTLFQEIAADIADSARLGCSLTITSSDVDPSELALVYLPGDAAPPEPWTQVTGERACGDLAAAFYVDGPLLRLCPATCAAIASDLGASFEVSCAHTAP